MKGSRIVTIPLEALRVLAETGSVTLEPLQPVPPISRAWGTVHNDAHGVPSGLVAIFCDSDDPAWDDPEPRHGVAVVNAWKMPAVAFDMKAWKDRAREGARELRRLAKALNLPDEGPQENVDAAIARVKALSADCDRLRRELDDKCGVIR